MKLHTLTYIVLEVNAALDTGKYDDILIKDISAQVEGGDVISWLRQQIPDLDLSLLTQQDEKEYRECLADIHGAYEGSERKNWGVENRGLCLIVAWTTELIQRRVWDDKTT